MPPHSSALEGKMKKYFTIIAAIIISFFFWNYKYLKFSSHSMEPTIMKGERVIVDLHRFRKLNINRWDIVAYVGPKGNLYMHRVVGLPGETIQIKEDSILINGKGLNIPVECEKATFIPKELMFENTSKGPFKIYEVPPRYYFLIGDNGKKSYDSRMNGPVGIERIKGKKAF
jgi:signal peptidase I